MHTFYGRKANGKLGDIIVENEKSSIQVGEAKESTGDYPFFTSGDAILRWKSAIINVLSSCRFLFIIPYLYSKINLFVDFWKTYKRIFSLFNAV